MGDRSLSMKWKCLKCDRSRHKTIWKKFKKFSKKDPEGIWIDICLNCKNEQIEE